MKKDSNLAVLKRKLKSINSKDKKGFIMGWVDGKGGNVKEALKFLKKNGGK